MNVDQFTTKNRQVRSKLADLREAVKGKHFSDVIDDENNQYVDIVMEGGGMLGIALIGYVYALESVGIRFLRIGGTSAGSINAMLMAAAGPKYEKSTDWILGLLANTNFYDFVDGDSDAKDFINTITQSSGFIKILWKGVQVIDNIREDLGLNPGNKFHNWISSKLTEKGVDTLEKLQKRRQQGNDKLKLRNGNKFESSTADRVSLVAADITTQTKVEFPLMAELYWSNPQQVNPADFVRASMSIPVFFHPYRVKNLPLGIDQQEKWRQVGYHGDIPSEVLFVDGGINSNFPIDLFHDRWKVPNAPTFGVKLGKDRYEPRSIYKPLGLISAIFDSARHVHDFTFINKNPDYRHLVTYLDTERFGWLDFDMPVNDKIELFKIGVEGACNFLVEFDWEKYKELRAETISVKHKSDEMDAIAAENKLKALNLTEQP